MKVARDPQYAAGLHPYHDTRLIVSDDWEPDEAGHWFARMSDCEDQAKLAHLFAAAPDLFDALEQALPYVEDAQVLGGFKKGVVEGHLKMIRAALARANP